MCGAEQCATAVWGEYGKALAGQATASVACRLSGWKSVVWLDVKVWQKFTKSLWCGW